VWYDTGEVDDLLAKLGISPEAAAKVEAVLRVIVDTIQNGFEFIQTAVSNLKAFWEQNGREILDNITNVFSSIWGVVETVLGGIYNIAVDVIQGKVAPFIKDQLESLRQFWEDNGQQIMEAVKNAFDFIKGVVEFVMPIVKFIIEVVWAAIADIIGGALNIIKGLIQVFTAIFTGDWSQLWEGIKKILSGAIDLIMGILSLNFLAGIKNVFMNLLKNGVTIIRNMWTKIVDFFRNFAGNASAIVSNMASKVWGFVKTMATN